jgi:hypothetical protein
MQDSMNFDATSPDLACAVGRCSLITRHAMQVSHAVSQPVSPVEHHLEVLHAHPVEHQAMTLLT